MNTYILNKKIKAYRGAVLTANTESVEQPPILLDDDAYPNTYILDEMQEDLRPDDESDKITALLDSSLESLRRLDVVMMNVNYPVSGYRNHISNSTILKADPGLEGMLPNIPMTKRQLSYSIENVGKKVLVAAIAAIIAALSAVIFKAIARLRKSRQVKPPTPEELEAAKAARGGQDKDKIEAYYNTVVWGQSSKQALATIMDIPATQARAELILEISKKIGDELDTLTKAAVALEKFADGGAFNSDIVRHSVDSEPREIYALVNKLEDDWEKLPTHDTAKPALTQNEYMNAVAALRVKVPDFNTPEFEKTSANVARLKDKLETLRKQVEKAKVADGATLSELTRLRKGVSNIGRLAMDLAGAYRAADEQAFAISKLYVSVRLYNTHASKVTGSYKKGE